MKTSNDLSLFKLGDRARDRGAWTSAAALYREALTCNAGNPGLWVQYGHACKEMGAIAKAEAAYRQAICLMPKDHDVRLQLGHLLKLCGDTKGAAKAYREAFALSNGDENSARELASFGVATPAAGDIHFDERPIIIDVSDVVRYAHRFSRPTGIQRVQIALIDALLDEADVARAVIFASCGSDGHWLHVSSAQLRRISARLQGAANPANQRIGQPPAEDDVRLSAAVSWPNNATYLMLGTAWDHLDYHKAVSRIKAASAVRIVSFIHDLVPVDRPDLCVPGLAYRFERWLTSALSVTDRWISNSNFTARRLRAFAEASRLAQPDVVAVSLNAPLPSAGSMDALRQGLKEAEAAIGFSPASQRFVLSVGTIEPRKNYDLLVQAWRKVASETAEPPILVIAGKVGWSASRPLKAIADAQADGLNIRHVADLSDAGLQALYRHCQFLLYPSLMEGWGLPVTEALAHGRVPVLGEHSGVAEAAGAFGHYVNVNSADQMAQAIIRLIENEQLRSAHEDSIRSEFKNRSWREISQEIIDVATSR